MKRSGFKRPTFERQQRVFHKLAGPVNLAKISGDVRAKPKSRTVRDSEYRRLVTALPCIMCGIEGRSQAAHPNTGKGIGQKADGRLCFPLCADGPGYRGCHSLFDQGAAFSKAERREKEIEWAVATQESINALGRGYLLTAAPA